MGLSRHSTWRSRDGLLAFLSCNRIHHHIPCALFSPHAFHKKRDKKTGNVHAMPACHPFHHHTWLTASCGSLAAEQELDRRTCHGITSSECLRDGFFSYLRLLLSNLCFSRQLHLFGLAVPLSGWDGWFGVGWRESWLTKRCLFGGVNRED